MRIYATTSQSFNPSLENPPDPTPPPGPAADDYGGPWRLAGVTSAGNLTLYWGWERDVLKFEQPATRETQAETTGHSGNLLYIDSRPELGPLTLPGDRPALFLAEDTHDIIVVGSPHKRMSFRSWTRVELCKCDAPSGGWFVKVWDRVTLEWLDGFYSHLGPNVTTTPPGTMPTPRSSVLFFESLSRSTTKSMG